MVYLGNAHVSGDILIHISEEKILVVGDCFHLSYLPYIDSERNYDVQSWIKVLDYFLNKKGNVETVVCGHREELSGEYLKKYCGI